MVRITERQKTLFLDLISRNYTILFGRYVSADGTRIKAIKWNEIMDEVNYVGPEKSLEKWKRCWADLKKGSKEKLTAISKHRQKTGGGGPCPTILTEQDQIIINICGMESLSGLPGDELGVDNVPSHSPQRSARFGENSSSISSTRRSTSNLSPRSVSVASTSTTYYHPANESISSTRRSTSNLSPRSVSVASTSTTYYHPANEAVSRNLLSSAHLLPNHIGLSRSTSEASGSSSHSRVNTDSSSLPWSMITTNADARSRSITMLRDSQSEQMSSSRSNSVASNQFSRLSAHGNASSQRSRSLLDSMASTERDVERFNHHRPNPRRLSLLHDVVASASSQSVNLTTNAMIRNDTSKNSRGEQISSSRSNSVVSNQFSRISADGNANNRRSRSRSHSMTRTESDREILNHQRAANMVVPTLSRNSSISTHVLLSKRLGLPWNRSGLSVPAAELTLPLDKSSSQCRVNAEHSSRSRTGNEGRRSRSRSISQNGREQAISRSNFMSRDRERSRSIATSPSFAQSRGGNRNRLIFASTSTAIDPISPSRVNSSVSTSFFRPSLSPSSYSHRSRNRSNSITGSVTNSYSVSRRSSITDRSSLRTDFRSPSRSPVHRNLTGTLASTVEDARRVQKNIERKLTDLNDKHHETLDVMKDMLLELRRMRQNNG